MSRSVFAYHAPDISALARSLVKQWVAEPAPPGHVQMLNMLARAAGHANFQSYRAGAETPPVEPVDAARINQLLRYFDVEGRLYRWPAKLSNQLACLWPIWAAIPSRRILHETQVNQAIQAVESFGDHVLLRRELVNNRMLTRNPDGSDYRRVEQVPPDEARALIRAVEARRR